MRDYHGGEVTGYLRGSHSLMGEVKSWSLEDPRLIVDDFEIQLVIPKLLTKLTNIMMKIKDDSKFPRCGHVCCVGGAMWFSPRREISSSSDEQPLAHAIAINPAPMSKGGQLTKLFYKLYVKFFTQHRTIHRLVHGLIFLLRWVLF